MVAVHLAMLPSHGFLITDRHIWYWSFMQAGKELLHGLENSFHWLKVREESMVGGIFSGIQLNWHDWKPRTE